MFFLFLLSSYYYILSPFFLSIFPTYSCWCFWQCCSRISLSQLFCFVFPLVLFLLSLPSVVGGGVVVASFVQVSAERKHVVHFSDHTWHAWPSRLSAFFFFLSLFGLLCSWLRNISVSLSIVAAEASVEVWVKVMVVVVAAKVLSLRCEFYDHL